jgi:hypothetical protein
MVVRGPGLLFGPLYLFRRKRFAGLRRGIGSRNASQEYECQRDREIAAQTNRMAPLSLKRQGPAHRVPKLIWRGTRRACQWMGQTGKSDSGIAEYNNRRMKTEPAELLRDALSLPAAARAALIDSLIASLDVEIDENAEDAWREEIHLRLRQIDSGAVRMIPWADARSALHGKLMC